MVWYLAETAVMAAAGAAVGAGVPAVALTAAAWLAAGIAFGLYDRRWWTYPHLLPTAAARTWAASSGASWLAARLLALSAAPLTILVLPLAALGVAVALRMTWRAIAVRRRKHVVVVDAVGEERLAVWLAYYWPEWEMVDLVDARDAAARSFDPFGKLPSTLLRASRGTPSVYPERSRGEVEGRPARRGATVAYYVNGQAVPLRGDVRALPLDDLLEQVSGRVLLEHGDSVSPPRSRGGTVLKRLTDVCVAAGGLVALAPLMAVLAALIKLESKGPVIYRQRRLGRGRRSFEMLKFRSMIEQAEQATGPVWARPNDPRCTPLGRLMRPLHLDELPQLVNVLRGEMSLVGPRPERPELAEDLLGTIPAYDRRLAVRPGVTGWAQVNQGYDRGVDDVRRKLEYDLFYVKHLGALFDAAILLRTADAVIFGKTRGRVQPWLP